MDHPTSNVVATPVLRKYNVSMDYPWIIHGSSDIQCGSHPSTSEIQCIHGLSMDHPNIQCGSHPSNSEIQCIHGLSMDLPTSNVVAHNVSMDYPRLSMDHPTSNVVATPVIQKCNVSMDYPWIIHGSSNIQCSSPQCIHGLSTVIHGSSDIQSGSHPSNSKIQSVHGFSGRIQHPSMLW